jgi:uncharacterized protein (DUF1330 family)
MKRTPAMPSTFPPALRPAAASSAAWASEEIARRVCRPLFPSIDNALVSGFSASGKLLDPAPDVHYDAWLHRRLLMAKGYWVAFYHTVSNPEALAEYAKLAGPAIQAGGGRILARGLPAKTYEAAKEQRVVVIEFDSVQQAIAAHDSEAYKAAMKVLGNAVEREIRIIEGVA